MGDDGAMLIELRQVTKRFAGVVANESVNLGIRAGEVHVLIGENGAGKSTVAGLLAGLLQPDSGDVVVDGSPMTIDSPRRARALRIAVVRQHSMLVPDLTVAENLLLGGRWLARPDRQGVRLRLAADCEMFGSHIEPTRLAGDLSLGERQQLEIIKALWSGCRLLVLDEPTAMQASASVTPLIAILRQLTAGGTGILLITHKLDEALAAGDRVTILRRGRVAGEVSRVELRTGQPEALKSRMTELMFGVPPPLAADTRVRSSRPALGKIICVVNRLSVRSNDPSRTLDDVSFDVRAGEIFGIAGIDGNGQTTLAEAVAGQIMPAAGGIMFDGHDITRRSVAHRHQAGLRYISDNRLNEGSIAGFAVAINLILKRDRSEPFWTYGMLRRSALAIYAERLIAAYNIHTPSPWQTISRLSGGNIQKLILARELSGTVKLVVCNKPTNGLDLQTAATIHRRIREHASRGVAFILISSDTEELLALSDRIGVMFGGELIEVVANDPSARQVVQRLMAGVPVG